LIVSNRVLFSCVRRKKSEKALLFLSPFRGNGALEVESEERGGKRSTFLQ